MSDPTPATTARQHTGALARIARAQATHPKRTVFGGLGVFVLILFLAFGPLKGTLENKFSIPGSDAQKATDVLAAKFDARNGGVLQVVMVAPDGERLDTPERKAAIDARPRHGRQGRVGDRRHRPVRRQQPALLEDRPAHRLRRGAVLRGRLPARPRQDRRPRERHADRAREGRHQHRVHRRRRAGAARAGRERVHRLRVALLVLLLVFRTLVAAAVPIVFALISVGTAFGLLFLLANLTDFNTITPILISMIGIGVGIDYTLFIVTRYRQAAARRHGACRMPPPMPRPRPAAPSSSPASPLPSRSPAWP